MIHICPESDRDRDAIRAVHLSSFPTPDEADLVDALRDAGAAAISLVALEGDRVVGHALFSPVTVEGAAGRGFLGLAPVAVLPGHRRRGIAGALIKVALRSCREMGVGGVVVLGEPGYYGRFGFRAATEWGLRCKWDDAAPEGAFQAMELVEGALGRGEGRVVEYRGEFDGVS